MGRGCALVLVILKLLVAALLVLAKAFPDQDNLKNEDQKARGPHAQRLPEPEPFVAEPRVLSVPPVRALADAVELCAGRVPSVLVPRAVLHAGAVLRAPKSNVCAEHAALPVPGRRGSRADGAVLGA